MGMYGVLFTREMIGSTQCDRPLTVERVCRMLAAIDCLRPADSGRPSLCVTKDDRRMEGAMAFPEWRRKMDFMNLVHLPPRKAFPRRF